MTQVVSIKFVGDEKGLEKSLSNILRKYEQLNKGLEGSKKRLEDALPNQKSLDRVSRQIQKVALESGASVDEITAAFLRLSGEKGIGGAVKEIKAIATEAEKVGKTFNQQLKVVLDGQEQILEAQAQKTAALERGFRNLSVAAGGVSATFLGLGGVAVQTGIQFESLQAALATSLGGESEAEKAFLRIQELAKTTPFQVQEITESFIKLQNRGIEPTNETLIRLGDISSSQGKSLDQITEAILDAAVGEGERLKEFGIRASFAGEQATLAFKGTNLEVAKTPEAITEAVLSFGNFEGVAGGMAKQAATLGGQLSNLQDGTDELSLVFFELVDGPLKAFVGGANTLLSTFLEMPAPLQSLLLGTTAFAGILATAATALAAYQALGVKQIATETALAAKTIATTVATKAKTVATLGAAAAQGKLTVAQLAAVKSTGLLLAKLAIFVAAVEAVTAAVDQYGAADFKKETDSARKALEAFGEATNAEEPLKRNVEAYRSWIDVLGLRASARIEATRANVDAFSEDLYRNVDAIQASAEAGEDVAARQTLYEDSLASVQAAIASLDEEMLGTEAYDEQKAELQVLENLLTKNAGAWGLVTEEKKKEAAVAAQEAEAKKIEEKTTAIEAQTEALEKQIDALNERAGAEDITADRKFEDEKIGRTDAADKAKLARERKFQAEQLARERQNADEVEAIKAEQAEATRKIEAKRKREDLAAEKAVTTALEDIKDRREKERQQIEIAADQAIATEKKSREESKRTDDETFAQSMEDLKDASQVARDDRKLEFDKSIETIKDQAAAARQAAEKALADEISNRLNEQAASFSDAGRILSEQEKLAAAETEEERAAIRARFAEEERQREKVASLELANQVFSGDELVKLAQDVSGIKTPTNEEEAKQLQQALAQIEAEQKAQQAEADAAAKLALQAELDAQAKATEDEIEAKQLAFKESERQLDIEHREKLQALEREFKAEQRRLDEESAARIKGVEANEATLIEASTTGEEQEVAAVEDAATQAKAVRDEERRIQDEARAIAFEDVLEQKQQAFADSQRSLDDQFKDQQNAKQAAFEASEREKKRAFDDAERAKDKALALEIKAIEEEITALKEEQSNLDSPSSGETPDVTDIEPRLKGGPVVPGKTYLGGERNPEPIQFGDGKTAMVGLNGPELFRVPKKGQVFPSTEKFREAIAKVSTPLIAPPSDHNKGDSIGVVANHPQMATLSPSVVNNNVNNVEMAPLLHEMKALRRDIGNMPVTGDTLNYYEGKGFDFMDFQRDRLRTRISRGKL